MVEMEKEKKKEKKPFDRFAGGRKKERPKPYEKDFDYEKSHKIEKYRREKIETMDVKNDRSSRKASYSGEERYDRR